MGKNLLKKLGIISLVLLNLISIGLSLLAISVSIWSYRYVRQLGAEIFLVISGR